MTDLINALMDKLAKQRSVSLYVRQEERISKINETYNLDIKPIDVIRLGVDLALDELEAKLKKGE